MNQGGFNMPNIPFGGITGGLGRGNFGGAPGMTNNMGFEMGGARGNMINNMGRFGGGFGKARGNVAY